MTTVYLKGDLGDRFVPEFRLNANSVREAVAILEVNFPGLRSHLIDSHERGIGYRVIVGQDWEIAEDQINLPTGEQTITISPVIGGHGAVGRIITGVALLGLGLTGVGLLGLSASTLALTGGVLALGGVVGLFNNPKTDASSDEQKTLVFNGPVNTVAAGGVVPITYGEIIGGSQVISAAIRTTTEIFDDEDDSD